MSDENDSWLGGIGISVQKFFSSDPDQGGSSTATAAPPALAAPPTPAATSTDDGGFTPVSGATSSDPAQGGSSQAPSADYNQGYQDGQNGAASSGPPRAGSALKDYENGYTKGHEEYVKKEGLCTEYNRGFQDGLNGKPSAAGPLAPDYLAEYERGYKDGQAKGEVAFEVDGDVVTWITVRGVVYGVRKVLQIGSGIWGMIVVMTAGMKCDNRRFRFKCPTCGVEGDLQCTAEEAAADRDAHKQKFPEHVPTSTPPDSYSGDPP